MNQLICSRHFCFLVSSLVAANAAGLLNTAPAGAAPGLIASKDNDMPSAPKQFDLGQFTTVDKVKLMPESVRKALGELLISDAGGPFNAGCCVDLSKLEPMTRLVFAAKSKDTCIMHYEQGGIAHFYKVTCYNLLDSHGKPLDKAEVRWKSMTGNKKLESLADLNKLISSGQLRVDPKDIQY